MASAKILAAKQKTIDEIKNNVQSASTYVLFDYRGLTDGESKELRRKLRETGSDYKVYKNTLMARAFADLNVDIDANLVGPSALAFGTDQVAPIKVLSDFAKNHDALILKVGVVVSYFGSSSTCKISKYPITRWITHNACWWYDANSKEFGYLLRFIRKRKRRKIILI